MPCRPTNRSACWALGALTTLVLSVGGTAHAGGSIPARSGWYQIPRTQLERVCTRQPEVQGVMGCRGITEGWSSAVFDTKRNRLVI